MYNGVCVYVCAYVGEGDRQTVGTAEVTEEELASAVSKERVAIMASQKRQSAKSSWRDGKELDTERILLSILERATCCFETGSRPGGAVERAPDSWNWVHDLFQSMVDRGISCGSFCSSSSGASPFGFCPFISARQMCAGMTRDMCGKLGVVSDMARLCGVARRSWAERGAHVAKAMVTSIVSRCGGFGACCVGSLLVRPCCIGKRVSGDESRGGLAEE